MGRPVFSKLQRYRHIIAVKTWAHKSIKVLIIRLFLMDIFYPRPRGLKRPHSDRGLLRIVFDMIIRDSQVIFQRDLDTTKRFHVSNQVKLDLSRIKAKPLFHNAIHGAKV